MVSAFKHALIGALVLITANVALAQGTVETSWGLTLHAIISTIVYSLLGLIILLFAYKVFDWVTPYDIQKELAEDDNTAVGVMMAGVFIALAVIIAAAVV